jgi:hypothetical protein
VGFVVAPVWMNFRYRLQFLLIEVYLFHLLNKIKDRDLWWRSFFRATCTGGKLVLPLVELGLNFSRKNQNLKLLSLFSFSPLNDCQPFF